jgi:outer membrane protein TolC
VAQVASALSRILIMPTHRRTTGRLRVGLWLLGSLLTSAVGCSHKQYGVEDGLALRILPPPNSDVDQAPAAPENMSREPADDKPARPGGPRTAEAVDAAPAPPPALRGPRTADAVDAAPAPPPALRGPGEAPCEPGQALTLPDAIALAFRLQPRLRASEESIQQAQGREGIAFAAFLPTLTSGYVVGGYHIQAGGVGFPVSGAPNSPNFTVLPFLGSVPVGIQGQTGFEVAELKLQWLVCDFGRRLGRYHQADLAVDIAGLQTQRAYQTVANDVAVAYYQLLRAQSLHRIATESVRRGRDDLDVARKLGKRGVIEREKVLRAEVALAHAQRALDVAEETEAIAVASLNLAIGLNVSAPTRVVDRADVPPFPLGLGDSLRTAVANRREFQVARQVVQVAQVGSRVACADFAPRIVAEGNFLDFQQSNPRGHFDLPFAFIKLEWNLFEGGKRIAALRVADSRIREALAQAESIADTIAFQVNQAYRQLVTARKGIDRSRPAVDQARETYRLVVARSRLGDATPAELTEAEADLTRAEQDYANSVYDYLTALERIQFAMGTTPTPLTAQSHH